MNYFSMKPIYLDPKTKRKKTKTSAEIIDVCVMHPALMRRLVNLDEELVVKKKGVTTYLLEDKNENPLFPEMKKAGINRKMVAEASDFINFCQDEENKKYEEYRRQQELADW